LACFLRLAKGFTSDASDRLLPPAGVAYHAPAKIIAKLAENCSGFRNRRLANGRCGSLKLVVKEAALSLTRTVHHRWFGAGNLRLGWGDGWTYPENRQHSPAKVQRFAPGIWAAQAKLKSSHGQAKKRLVFMKLLEQFGVARAIKSVSVKLSLKPA